MAAQLVLAGNVATTQPYDVVAGGGYIYVADSTSGLRAFSFDGTNFTARGVVDNGLYYSGIAYTRIGGTPYIMAVREQFGFQSHLTAYTHDGTTLANVADYAEPGTVGLGQVCSAGDTVFLVAHPAANDRLRAFSFNGVAFTQEDSWVTTDTLRACDARAGVCFLPRYTGTDGIDAIEYANRTLTHLAVRADPTWGIAESVLYDSARLYIGTRDVGLVVLGWNNNLFSEIARASDGFDSGVRIALYNDRIFYSRGSSGVTVYRLDGTTLTNEYTIDPGNLIAVDTDGTYLYGANYAAGSSAVGIVAYGILWAEFDGTPLAGFAGVTVQFTPRTTLTAQITSWAWNFGDGTTSTEQAPVHIYPDGQTTYDVSLTVTYAGGSDTVTKADYIRIYGANFTVEPDAGRAPLEVLVTDQSDAL